MFWLKACRRCTGDLYEVLDIEGRYVKCLQCGRELSAQEELALRVGPPAIAARPRVARAA